MGLSESHRSRAVGEYRPSFPHNEEIGVARFAIYIAHKIQPQEMSSGSDLDSVTRILGRRLWRNPVNGNLYAPNFDRDRDNRNFNLNDVQGKWNGNNSVVAFRAISSYEKKSPPTSGRWGFLLKFSTPATDVFSDSMER